MLVRYMTKLNYDIQSLEGTFHIIIYCMLCDVQLMKLNKKSLLRILRFHFTGVEYHKTAVIIHRTAAGAA